LFFRGGVGEEVFISTESMGFTIHHSRASGDTEWQLHPWLLWNCRVSMFVHVA